MQAMILAAGFGTRLKPYTLLKPKPLFPVLNTPLLIGVIKRLKNDGFTKIIVNCHHLAEQITEAVESIHGVIIQHEETILGTGGGLREACDKIDDEPLLVTNGDIYHTINFSDLYRYHCGSENKITMAVHDFIRFNNIAVTGDKVLHFNGNSGDSAHLAYTGIQVINPDLLLGIKKSSASCIIEYYRCLLTDGEPIHVRRVDDSYWTDMGTPQDYLHLHRDLLIGTVPRWKELACDAQAICVDRDADCGEHVKLQDWAAVGKAHIGGGATLTRCVVWDGADIDPDANVTDQIIVPGLSY